MSRSASRVSDLLDVEPLVVRVRAVRRSRRATGVPSANSVVVQLASSGAIDVVVVEREGPAASSSEIISSCSFSPGRMPTISSSASGAMASARSVIVRATGSADEQLAAVHPVEGVDDEPHRLVERDPEPGHALVGDRQRLADCGEPAEQRHDRAPAADDVAVPHDGEARVVGAGVVVAGDEQLVGAQLRSRRTG